MYLQITIILNLLLIAYQDFKSRSIGWYAVALLLIQGVLFRYIDYLTIDGLYVSYGYLLAIGIGLFLYYGIKNRGFYNWVDNDLGLGDILLLLIFPLLMNELNFLIYFMLTMVVGIVAGLLYFQPKGKTIPLASVMAVIYLLILVMFQDLSYPIFQFNN